MSNPASSTSTRGGLRFLEEASTRLPVLTRISTATVCDVDNDADPDMIVTRGPLPNAELWINDGRGSFSRSTQQVPGWSVPIDSDLDGDVDLHAGGELWVNDGSGRFTLHSQRSSITHWLYPDSMVDLDGDGDPDERAPWASSINLYRQIQAPFIPRLGHPFAIRAVSHASSSLIAIPGLSLSTIHQHLGDLGVWQLGNPIVVLQPRLVSREATWRADLPAIVSLTGMTCHIQALFLEAQDAHVSNRLEESIR